MSLGQNIQDRERKRKALQLEEPGGQWLGTEDRERREKGASFKAHEELSLLKG